jgi:phage FluMu protein Com
MIEFRCSKCDGVVRAPEAHAGKKGRCPTCQEIVPIPEKSERLEPVEFPCEKCGHGMKAPGKFVGRQGKCAKCGHLMTIPAESVPHGDALPVAKPVAKAPGGPGVVQAKPVQPAVTKPVQAAASKPAQPATPKPAQPAAAKPAQAAPAANPFAQPQPKATGPAAQPNPFAQPQQKPAAQPNAFAQPHQAAKPQPAPAANDPFADLGNFGSPAMAPMPMAPAMSAHGPYAAPGPYGATAHRPSGSSTDVPGIISMILGIVSLVLVMGGCCCLPFSLLSLFTGIAGIITGLFGKSGFRVAGIITSSIAVLLAITLICATIVFYVIGATADGGANSFESDPWGPPFEPEFGNDF